MFFVLFDMQIYFSGKLINIISSKNTELLFAFVLFGEIQSNNELVQVCASFYIIFYLPATACDDPVKIDRNETPINFLLPFILNLLIKYVLILFIMLKWCCNQILNICNISESSTMQKCLASIETKFSLPEQEFFSQYVHL